MSTPSVSAPLLSGAMRSQLNGADTGPGGAKMSKIHHAAQQFEALMINEMMKSEREAGDGGWLGSGDETGDSTGVEMAESQFSQALAASGGLGLSHMIEQNLGRQAVADAPADSQPGKPTIGPKS